MPGSVVNVSPLIFSPFVCSLFLCAIVDLPQREMDPSFSGLLAVRVVASLFETSSSFSWSTFITRS